MEKKIKELINDVYKKSTTMPAKEPDKETIAAQEMYLETGLVPQLYVDSISKGRFNIKTHSQPHKTLRDILNGLKRTTIPVDNNMRMCGRKEREINLLLEPHGFCICRDKNTPHLPPILDIDCRIIIEPIEEVDVIPHLKEGDLTYKKFIRRKHMTIIIKPSNPLFATSYTISEHLKSKISDIENDIKKADTNRISDIENNIKCFVNEHMIEPPKLLLEEKIIYAGETSMLNEDKSKYIKGIIIVFNVPFKGNHHLLSLKSKLYIDKNFPCANVIASNVYYKPNELVFNYMIDKESAEDNLDFIINEFNNTIMLINDYLQEICFEIERYNDLLESRIKIFIKQKKEDLRVINNIQARLKNI